MKMNSQAMLYHISRLHEVCEEFVLGPEPSHWKEKLPYDDDWRDCCIQKSLQINH